MNQILKRQTSRSHYGSKSPAVTITVFKYRNKIGRIVVKTVPYSVNVNVKNTFTSHIDKKNINLIVLFRCGRWQKLTIVWSPTVNVYKRAMIMIVKHFLYTNVSQSGVLIIPLAEFNFTNSRFFKLTCDCTLVNLVIYCINTSFLPLPHVQSKAEQCKEK